MKIRGRITKFVIVIVVIAVAFFAGIVAQHNFTKNSEPIMTSDLIANEIKSISQYASLEYRYTNVGKYEDQAEFYGWKVPFTTKIFIITYDGSMKFGIDSDEIQVDVVGDTIKVKLPKSKILSHEIFEDSLEVMDQSKNVFNQIQVEDYTGFAADQKDEMEAKAEEEGLFEEADKNARGELKEIVSSLPGIKDEYTVEIESISK